jgi:hypothetical protein
MRTSLGVALVGLASCISGCFSYAARIGIEPSDRAPGTGAAPSAEEVAEVVHRVVTDLGFVVHPRFEEIRRSSEESREYEHRVLSDYVVASPLISHRRIGVSLLGEKRSGSLLVLIRDLDAMRPTKETVELEAALTSALRSQFPSAVVTVERETVGPDLAP